MKKNTEKLKIEKARILQDVSRARWTKYSSNTVKMTDAVNTCLAINQSDARGVVIIRQNECNMLSETNAKPN